MKTLEMTKAKRLATRNIHKNEARREALRLSGASDEVLFDKAFEDAHECGVCFTVQLNLQTIENGICSCCREAIERGGRVRKHGKYLKGFGRRNWGVEPVAVGLQKHLKANGRYEEVADGFGNRYHEDNDVKVLVEDGDWKHDHLYVKQLVRDFYSARGLTIRIESETVREDGSDCYSAIHHFIVEVA